MASPATWTAYVKKNQVVWANNSFDLEKEADESLSFTTKVINTGGVQQSYAISNLPVWLTASPEMGLLDPDSEQEIVFTVADGLNVGTYNEDIFLVGTSGYNERLTLNVNVYRKVPVWEVDETAFNSSMNIIAQLKIKEVISNDKFDRIGVFAGNECRGVCNLEYKANYDSYFAFLVVYGNTSGEVLTYKVWDASEGKVFSDVTPTYNFTPNGFYGNMQTPVMFAVGGKVDNSVSLNKGWNWLSFNLDMDDASMANVFSGVNVSDADQVKHAEYYATYDANVNVWKGSLANVEIGKLYRAKINQGGVLTYIGEEVLCADHAIELVNGWNRIGFVPSVNMTVNEALAGFEPQVNDLLKSQYDFAMYDGYEWIGSLNYMTPGKGYMYNSGNSETISFVYPEASQLNKKEAKFDINPALSNYGIKAESFEYVMSITARVSGNNLPEGAIVGAYVNGELRGVARVTNFNGYNNYCWFTVYGQANDYDRTISFALLNGDNSIEISGTSLFAGNNADGDLLNPVELIFNGAVSIAGIQQGALTITPNPFNHELNVNFKVEQAGRVSIKVFNTLGELVAVLVDSNFDEGSYAYQWNGLKSANGVVQQGIYFMHVTINNNLNVIRVVKE